MWQCMLTGRRAANVSLLKFSKMFFGYYADK